MTCTILSYFLVAMAFTCFGAVIMAIFAVGGQT